MCHNQRKEPNVNFPLHKYAAVSLIEILLTLVLGTIILLSTAKWFSDTLYHQTKQRERLNLQQHTHQLLDYLQQHIQHTGFQGVNRKNDNIDLFLYKGKAIHLATPSCLTFFYDVNQDGCVGDKNYSKPCQQKGVNNANDTEKEIFGFKFDKNHLLVLDDKFKKCRPDKCQSWATACNQRGKVWKNITDLVEYQIEKLHFEWVISDKLLRIELILKSVKYPKIQYQATAYSYLLNSGD